MRDVVGHADRGDRGVVFVSAIFVLLLATAIIWPRPVLWINDATVQADLPISSVSFLGREAPSWDVVYWALVGLAVLGLFHGRLDAAAATWNEVRHELSGLTGKASSRLRAVRAPRMLAVAIGAAAICTGIVLFVDAPLMAQVSRVSSERVHDYVRLSNRLGGGGNPPMVIGFFVLSGLALRRARWALMGVAMAVSAASAGLLAAVLKPLVARSRPDLWLGPLSRAWGGESSLPSGHTISAFAIAGAVMVGSRSVGLRVVMLLAATSIATTRVIALRHWPSDVLVSAILGTALGIIAGRLFVRQDLDRREN